MSSGTLTVTETQLNALVHVSLAWTSTSGGAVSGQPSFNLPVGYLVLFYYNSSTATDAVVQTLADVNGLSILTDGAGGDLGTITDGDAPFRGVPFTPDVAADGKARGQMFTGLNNPYTLVVSGAGDAASATIDLYIERIV